MISWMHDSFPGHEVNLVLARGLSADTLVEGLRGLHREPLAHGEAGGWAWAVHDMFEEGTEDYDPVDYRSICPEGTEVIVFETEPCSAKAHGPNFTYLRSGRTTLHFSFEDIGQRLGDNPDHISAELLAANLIGPGAECDKWKTEDGHDCLDHEDDADDRLVKALADCFALPSPPLSLEVTAK
ncbi:hypothetical protein FHX80_113271 [Streptomyces brevispora]|uniref:Uncharacterized protein n=2 Tax=Streptomyces brevispora TaxID=887462 RepID=A0A561UZN2_9ACTN|nr:hypothetical protein [Streptomyces brevispora]TWG04799.1 hypothetical protein FHX80_113271 [Streptomyces brevispora]